VLLAYTPQLGRAGLTPGACARHLADRAEREGALADDLRAYVVACEFERALVRTGRVGVRVHRAVAIAGRLVARDGATGVPTTSPKQKLPA